MYWLVGLLLELMCDSKVLVFSALDQLYFRGESLRARKSGNEIRYSNTTVLSCAHQGAVVVNAFERKLG